ncbi:hypothetical protein AKJ55_01920 [candidate division MSBL1 archaeon SCGC-AAA382M17]|uniref:Glycosyltransferase 2-like domain-containing protein n=1 Tax=candidate division MSBL1 archaeon SCGC-AAA382M17 TaxID=1698284 RepID=A0ABR5TJ62_9EURY|nr:hypothetical protein AKJ55_01920 [candidate division MSBL1 archaeon SCGC-AAA382M17]
MPVYNEEEFVEETIDSVLNQTFENFEFIIVDDKSTDETREILKEYESNDRIRLFFNDENRGWAATVNRGIRFLKGEYIALVDSADLCSPERLEKQLNFLKGNGAVSVVGSYHHWIDEEGRIVGSYKFPEEPEEVEAKILGFASVTVSPSLMIERSVFEKVGLFNPDYVQSPDYEFFVRLIKNGIRIKNLPDFLLSVRKRKGRGTPERIKKAFSDNAKIKIRYLPDLMSLRNVLYAIVSVLILLFPAQILRKILNLSIKEGLFRDSLLGV